MNERERKYLEVHLVCAYCTYSLCMAVCTHICDINIVERYISNSSHVCYIEELIFPFFEN